MTRISTFALATLTVIAAASLTSTGASARGGGGAFGGGSFAGGFSLMETALCIAAVLLFAANGAGVGERRGGPGAPFLNVEHRA